MNTSNNTEKKYKTLAEFYPFYLSQHENSVCRRLHFVGTSIIILLILYVLFTGDWQQLVLLPLIGYGFAWIGHFFYEKNKPATFTYPVYSFISDWIMYKDIIIGKVRW
jgi:hypothetical protein